jgi:hypothetical protein
LVEKPGEKGVAGWWAELSSENAARGYAAVWRLADAPGASVPFLRRRLKPVTDAQADEIRQHIKDLDNGAFVVRKKAFEQLQNLGPAAAPALRGALDKNTSLEVRRRVEQLLDHLTNKPMSGEPLRTLRSLAVLEHAGTAEARRLLRALAAGAPSAWLTQEAKAVCARLARRS